MRSSEPEPANYVLLHLWVAVAVKAATGTSGTSREYGKAEIIRTGNHGLFRYAMGLVYCKEGD
jgi:hypothetical protein